MHNYYFIHKCEDKRLIIKAPSKLTIRKSRPDLFRNYYYIGSMSDSFVEDNNEIEVISVNNNTK